MFFLKIKFYRYPLRSSLHLFSYSESWELKPVKKYRMIKGTESFKCVYLDIPS